MGAAQVYFKTVSRPKIKTFEGNRVTICGSFFPFRSPAFTLPWLHPPWDAMLITLRLFKPSSDLLIQKLLLCSSACCLPSSPDVGSFWTFNHLRRHASKGSTPFVLCVVLERESRKKRQVLPHVSKQQIPSMGHSLPGLSFGYALDATSYWCIPQSTVIFTMLFSLNH